MEEKKELEIVSIDPVFFQDYHESPMNSCMSFGIECDDGWYNPLLKMVKKVSLLNKICHEKGYKIVSHQIKEKFGGLRVYWDIGSNEEWDSDFVDTMTSLMDDVVNTAEEDCWNTCELCGIVHSEETPIHSTKGWIKRLCDKCDTKSNKN